jgi:succinate dehydrogenase/fumarate reductase cytochrome b subunit
MKKKVKIGAVLAGAMPFLALAQTVSTTYLGSLIDGAKALLDQLVVFLISLAVVWFIWNVIRYTISEDEDKKAGAKSQMIWGIVAIAVIVSVWGLVAILQSIFGVNTTGAGDVNSLLPDLQN